MSAGSNGPVHKGPVPNGPVHNGGVALRGTSCFVLLVASLVFGPSTSSADGPAVPLDRSASTVAGWGLWQPSGLAPHLVLHPQRSSSFAEPPPGDLEGVGAVHGRPHFRGGHHRPEHVQGGRAAVPEAAIIYRKKVPYSYGYFGARPYRHWSLHHGHQQDRIEWVLR